MPSTPRSHFDEDIQRAWAMHDLASATHGADVALADDVGRVSVAFAVGALDAYLCDAFVDTLARTLKQVRRHGVDLPEKYSALPMPVGPLVTKYEQRQNWGLRMSARAMMERDNLLQLKRITGLFNPALPQRQQLWKGLIVEYIRLNRKRLTGIRYPEYKSLHKKQQKQARNNAAGVLRVRLEKIVQRRHDVVHNCDRPKSAVRPLSLGQAKAMLADVHDFVKLLDQHLDDHRLF